MLAAYFDESGTHGKESASVVVAGYIAESENWILFERAWKSALSDFGISCFHMTDYVSGHRRYQWGRQKEARFTRLQTITRRAVHAGIGVVLDAAAWKEHVTTPKDHRYFGTSHYDFCATSMLGMVAKWCDDNGVDTGIMYTFERGACGWKQFQHTYVKVYQDERLRTVYRMHGGLEFKDKRTSTPLQPADIAAYSLDKAGPSIECAKGKGWGVPFMERFHDLPVYIVTVNAEMLTKMKQHEEYVNAK